ncbi:hypothetical protein [Clavibacter zhangzhiyongii]|uniref:hypothetical protein n=1 Tax=Clavibacter zhangzhiyongii TaxID=2768071 RepID=UPI0039E13802
MKPPSVAASWPMTHVTAGEYALLPVARYAQFWTSPGMGVRLIVVPSTSVPVHRWPSDASRIAARNDDAVAARPVHAASPVRVASMVKNARTSMACSVDLNAYGTSDPSRPPV